MRAAQFDRFAGPIDIRTLPDPAPPPDGVVLRVTATGICRSDWHGWQGHDPDITLPHVPGHELAGEVVATGAAVRRWHGGERVTLPFVCGCGACPQCRSGNHQVCDRQFQPGFTHNGSFAEYVAIHYADTNLVALPEGMDDGAAAALGCRFITAFRAVIEQGRLRGGEWTAVYGCGGVGLSAVMIAAATGSRIIAVDIDTDRLATAAALGAEVCLDAGAEADIVAAVRDASNGGVHLGIDALGSAATCRNSIRSLRKRGRHVQVGLLTGSDHAPALPMDRVIAHELEILGSHGMAAFRFEAVFDLLKRGGLDPGRLVDRRVDLTDGIAALCSEAAFRGPGVMIIDRF